MTGQRGGTSPRITVTKPTNTGPLDGVRVVDLTTVIMGPLATQILGDLGADVITVEDPRGTLSRVMTAGPHPQLSGIALNLLRNKRNVVLDLKTAEGRDALLAVVATAQVFVTNLRPGTLERLGLSYEDIVDVQPDIVYLQAQGYPSDSAAADAPAYDDVIQAGTGLPDTFRRMEGKPQFVPTLIADKVCDQGGDELRLALHAAEGVGEAGTGLDHVVVGGGVGGRRVRRVPLGLEVHDVGLHVGDVLVGEAEPLQGARPEVGDEDLRRGDDGQQGVPPLGGLEVQHHVPLVAQQVEGDAGELGVGSGGHHPAQRASGVLDGDHVGPQVAEDLRGQRAHDDRGEVDHAHAVEGARIRWFGHSDPRGSSPSLTGHQEAAADG